MGAIRAAVGACVWAAAVVAAGGCGGAAGEARPDRGDYLSCPFADRHWTIDDKAALERLVRGLVALHKGGKTTEMSVLTSQLGRTRFEASLPPAPTRGMHPVSLYRRCREGVLVFAALVQGKKKNQWGVQRSSAFVLTGDGLVATCYHCLDHPDALTLGAMTFDGKVYAVKEVLAADKASDVAVLRLAASDLRPLALRGPVEVGTPVYAVGHPGRQIYTMTEGIVSRRYKRDSHGKRVPVLTVTVGAAGGSSGCPVVDRAGGVVGMITRAGWVYGVKGKGKNKEETAQMRINTCVPAEAILQCLGQ